jgi:hypothetical protein
LTALGNAQVSQEGRTATVLRPPEVPRWGAGDLQSDGAGTDHHGALRTYGQQSFHLCRVVQGPQVQHPLRGDVRPRRRNARRTRGNQEFVEMHLGLQARVKVPHRQRASLDVNGGDFVSGPYVDALGTVLLGGGGDETVWRRHESADQVGQTAGCIGGSGRALEDDELELVNGLHPSHLCRCGHSCGIAADDHQSSCHFFCRR